MARKARLHYSGAVYHVILHGNACQKIFFVGRDISILSPAARHLQIRFQKDGELGRRMVELRHKLFEIPISQA